MRGRHGRVDHHPVLAAGLIQDRDDALGVVGRRDQVDQDGAGVAERAAEVVDVVVGAQVGVAGKLADCPAGLVLHLLRHRGVEADPGDGLQGLDGALLGRQDRRRRALERLPLGRGRLLAGDVGTLVEQIAKALAVRHLPLVFVTLDLTLLHDPGGFGLERYVLGLERTIVVQHALRALGVAHDTFLRDLAVDVDRGADALHDRDVVAVAFLRALDHLDRGVLAPHQLLALNGAARGDLELPGRNPALEEIVELVFPALVAIVEEHTLALVIIEVVILGHPDLVVGQPVLLAVADPGLGPGCELRLWVFALEFVTRDHFADEAPSGIDAKERARRIQIDVHRIGERRYHDDLVAYRGLRLVLGEDPPVTPAVVDGAGEAGVIGYVGRGIALDRPDHAAQDLGVFL